MSLDIEFVKYNINYKINNEEKTKINDKLKFNNPLYNSRL